MRDLCCSGWRRSGFFLSGSWPGRLALLAPGLELIGADVQGIEPLADDDQFAENLAQKLLGCCGGSIQHLDGHFFDSQHIAGETCHLIGMKKEGLLDVTAELRIELARVEGRIDVAGVGVGVAVDRSSGAIESFLYLFNADQGTTDAVCFEGGSGKAHCFRWMLARKACRFKGSMAWLSKHKKQPQVQTWKMPGT